MVLKIWTIPRGRPQNPLRAAPRRSKSGAPQAGHQVKILTARERHRLASRSSRERHRLESPIARGRGTASAPRLQSRMA